jgi:transcriptional regulator with XRE-family HTH domain
MVLSMRNLRQDDIVTERERRGIAQKQLANMIGASQGYLSLVENGQRPLSSAFADRIVIELSKWDRAQNLPMGVIQSEKLESYVEEQVKKEESDFQSIARDIATLLEKKNHDYGDSFKRIFDEFGDLSTFIRLTDKMGRLATLLKGEEQIKDEPIDDVYRDIAGYCILSLVVRNQKKGE